VDAAAFAEKCTGSLLRWMCRIGEWGSCDELTYSPTRNEVVIDRRPARYGHIESSSWCVLYESHGRPWFPREHRFMTGKDKDKFCYLLGLHLIGRHENRQVPGYILTNTNYIAAAERLVREYKEQHRRRIIGWLQVDPELLSVEAQALIVESALKYA
jgi:hypothetical protein